MADRIKICVNFNIRNNTIMAYNDTITYIKLIDFINNIYSILDNTEFDKNILNYMIAQTCPIKNQYSMYIVYKNCNDLKFCQALTNNVFIALQKKYPIGSCGYYCSLKRRSPKYINIIWLYNNTIISILEHTFSITMDTFIQSNYIKGNTIRDKACSFVQQIILDSEIKTYVGLNGESFVYGHHFRNSFEKVYFLVDNDHKHIDKNSIPETNIICDNTSNINLESFNNTAMLLCNKRKELNSIDNLSFKYIIFIICNHNIFCNMMTKLTYKLIDYTIFENNNVFEFVVCLFKKIEK